ncbi:YkvA family protein [Noviherbaspirillum sp. ST9]|uniref:YkvA family protein n=1 Tax=Noviherbaspirillum sp. ST9 TaxID=3401606 RepID=UPI003B58762D
MSLSDKIRGWARNIKRDGVTLWFAGKHAGTPLAAKLLCVFVVAYALSPIDLIPDFIPVLGYLDDVILLPCLIWVAVRLVPPDVLAECRTKAAAWMETEGRKPRNNWGILFVALVWIAVTWVLWKYLVSPYF